MSYIGPIVLLAAGYGIGDILLKDIRRYVVAARKGDSHASGMVLTYTFVGILLSLVVMNLISWLLHCSQLWYFPTFAIVFLINMMKQYKEENGSMEMPKVNQEFIDRFQADMAANAKTREEEKKKR